MVFRFFKSIDGATNFGDVKGIDRVEHQEPLLNKGLGQSKAAEIAQDSSFSIGQRQVKKA